MSEEFVYHILGGISCAAAGPVVAGMMLKQKETTLAATGVTSRYEGVLLPYPRLGSEQSTPLQPWGRGLRREGEGQPQQQWVQAEGGVFSGERAEQCRCKEPGFVAEAVLVPGSAVGFCDDRETGSLLSGCFHW